MSGIDTSELNEAISLHDKEEEHQDIHEEMDWWFYGASNVYNIHNYGRQGEDKYVFQVDVYDYLDDGTERADYSYWNTMKTYNIKEKRGEKQNG